MEINALLMNANDNIVVCVKDVALGSEVIYSQDGQHCTLIAKDNIPACRELPRPIIKDEASRDPLEPFRLKPLAEEPAPTGLSSRELFKREYLPLPAHDHSGRIGVFQSPLV